MSKRKAVIFDLNNTLRKESGKPRHDVLKKAQKEAKEEQVIVLSGESNKDFSQARDWLNNHHLTDAKLDMRPETDHSHDDSEKEHLLEKHISRQFKVTKAYDDKKSNVKMFKKHGIKAKKV